MAAPAVGGLGASSVGGLGARAGMPLFLQRSPDQPSDPSTVREVEDELPIQAKLVVGNPDDQYEREADHVAETVMRGDSSSPAGPASTPQTSNQSIQHKCSACASGKTCPACQSNANPIQAKSLDSSSPPKSSAPSIVKASDSGTPLSSGVRAKVEPVLGADLSNVRVHANSSANKAASSIGAKAFTHQNHIWLGPQQSPDDVELMAHEATHVAQQAQGAHSEGSVQRACACGGKGCKACDDAREEVFIQPKLEVNATRQFEGPATVSAGGATATGKGGAGSPAAEGEGEEGLEAESSEEEADASESSSAAPPAADGGEPSSSQAPAAVGGESSSSQAPDPAAGSSAETAGAGGGCVPECYRGASEKPVEEPDEAPPDPPPTEVEAHTSDGDEEELPEPDDCPPETEAAAPNAGGGPNSSSGGSADSSSAAPSGEAAAPDSSTEPSGPAADAGEGGAQGPSPGGGGGGPSGGGGGAPDVAPQSAGSPLDGAIAQAEGQRDFAVAGYVASSSSLIVASDGARALRGGIVFARGSSESSETAARRSAATARADQFFAGVANQLDQAIAFASEQVPDRLGAQAESAKAQIAASIEAQKSSISARIEAARSQARGDAVMAQREVEQQAESFVTTAEDQTSEAIDTLTATHADTMEEVGTLETTTLDHLNEIYAAGRTTLEGLGTTVGDECSAIGDTFAADYKGFRKCTKNGFWDGNLSQRRSAAQENAAHEVANGYHDRIVESARKRAREITRDGRKKDRCSVIAAASRTRVTLDEQLANVVTALGAARDVTIRQAGTARDGIIASIGDSLTSTLRQLDQQEHDQRQAADDTGYMQQVLQEQLAHAAATSLQRSVADAATAAQSAVAPLRARFAASPPPDLDALDQALSQVSERLNVALGGLQSTIEGGLALSVEQLNAAGGQGLIALDGVAQSNDELAGTVSDGFMTSMSVIAGTDNFAAQREGFTQQVQQSSTAGSDALTQALGGLQTACDTTTSAAETTLTDAAQELERNLRQGKQGIECAITQKATEAASHEAPAWKRLVAVLLVILVVVIVIAVIVATGGAAMAALAAAAGPIGAAILVGAAVGAVTSGLLAVASNLWNNRSWSQGVLKAVAIGALTGAIGGGLGAAAGLGVGLVVKGASAAIQVAAQFGAAMVTAGGLDVITQFVTGGFSFEHFSWGQLGITLVVTALTFGIGHKIATARANVPKSGGPPPPTPDATPPSAGTPVVEEPRIGFGREPGPRPGGPVEEPRIGFGREPGPRPGGPVEEPRIGFGREPAPRPGGPVEEPRIGFGREPGPRPGAPVEEPRIGFGREPGPKPAGTAPVEEPRIGFGREPGPKPAVVPGQGEPGVVSGPSLVSGPGRSSGQVIETPVSDPLAPRAMAGQEPPGTGAKQSPSVVPPQERPLPAVTSTEETPGVITPTEKTTTTTPIEEPSTTTKPTEETTTTPIEEPSTTTKPTEETTTTPIEEPSTTTDSTEETTTTPIEEPSTTTKPTEETSTTKEPGKETTETGKAPEETTTKKTPWQRPKGWRLPKDGKWSGDVGDSTFTPNNPKSLGLNEGDVIQYHEGSPDFRPWQHGADLEVPGMTGVHKDDMPLIWEQVARQQGLRSANAATEWASARGLTPHHQGGNTVILVPSKLHGGIRHTGGAFELRTGG